MMGRLAFQVWFTLDFLGSNLDQWCLSLHETVNCLKLLWTQAMAWKGTYVHAPIHLSMRDDSGKRNTEHKVNHPVGWGSSTRRGGGGGLVEKFVPSPKVCLPWVSKGGTWDVAGTSLGCLGFLGGVFRKLVPKKCVCVLIFQLLMPVKKSEIDSVSEKQNLTDSASPKASHTECSR